MMPSPRRIRTTYTQQHRAAKEQLKQVPQDHLRLELQWRLGHNFIHQRLSIGLLRQKLIPIAPGRHSVGRSPTPYPREMEGKEAQ